MREVTLKTWLHSLAVMVGITCSANAQDNQYLKQAEAIFNDAAPSAVQQISQETCGPESCVDFELAESCDFHGDSRRYRFGADEAWDLGDSLFAEDSGWDIGGWTQWGYTNRSDGMFNNSPGRFNNHQSWLFVEKIADGSNGVGFGGRVDLIYGIDGPNTQAFGNRPGHYDFENGWDHGNYGWALPQLYAEAAYEDWNVKAGHFYTLLGYEVVAAPGNFFYSHSFTMYHSESFTHTGVLSTYTASDNVTIYGGWTLGWDTGFDQFNGGSSLLGGASVGITDDVTWTYILTAGNLGFIGTGYSHSFVSDWDITDNLEYVFQSDLLTVETIGGTGRYETIGINQYLFYTLSDSTKIGGRAEWWKADGVSYYEVTAGVNYKPMANLTLRPEIRYQWAPAVNNDPANQIVPVDEGAIFGIDAILTF